MAQTARPHSGAEDTEQQLGSGVSNEKVIAEIDAAEFERARKDPKLRKFAKESDEYLDAIEREGRFTP